MVNCFTGVEQSEPTNKFCSTEVCLQFQAACVHLKLLVRLSLFYILPFIIEQTITCTFLVEQTITYSFFVEQTPTYL